MNCPHCHSTQNSQRQCTANLGCSVFCCQESQRSFNERTGTPFNLIEVPTNIVFQVFLCLFWYKLDVLDAAEEAGVNQHKPQV